MDGFNIYLKKKKKQKILSYFSFYFYNNIVPRPSRWLQSVPIQLQKLTDLKRQI